VEETDIQSDGNPLSLSPNIYFSLVAPSDSSSRTSGGTFFSDTLPEGAPGITVLVASLPEEESSGLSPEARDLLEKISSADNRSTGDESDGHRHFARFREIFLDEDGGRPKKSSPSWNSEPSDLAWRMVISPASMRTKECTRL